MRTSIPTASLLLLLLLPAAGPAAPLDTPPAGLERGLRVHQRAAWKHPDRPAVLNDLGNLLALDGRPEEAEEAYRNALSVAPDHAAARFNLALLLQEQGRHAAALDELRRLLRQHPDHAWGHYQAGTLLDRKRRDARALRHYVRALELEPRLAEPEFNPHIVRNRLRTRAMLGAYRSQPPGTIAPRMYGNPKRVARLLVPTPAAPSDAGADTPTGTAEPAPEEPRKRRRPRG